MGYELKEVDPETDFPEIARCLFESYEDPPQKFFSVFFPIHGTGDEARREALEEAAQRLHFWHVNDPSSYWQKVVDTDSSKIVGGALWNIHKENPFAEQKHSEITWYPNDSSREYVAQALGKHVSPRARMAQRAHVDLYIIFTHPDYRRRGVGQQIMDWGKNKADEMNVEFWLDSTPYGRPLYEANDFVYVYENVNSPERENPDEKWKEMEEKIGTFTFWVMWRPVGGKYEGGKTIKPWEQ
ncbi:hypothetical protein K469DRAFT_702208 [Zopfia rhizophila CBS 207.26]|uniref:N-acetyltransferase domain-containing protein n=1 Tax=Zopfia rhizophila CBS 207.26 TaxID=1314779 RepID=A0A6A6D7T5_9PEZI|nr:hypothetical protein K469DRAFT_702208 [Zopfia rhizophila CBS 207.26]